jgi:hypothetical protein
MSISISYLQCGWVVRCLMQNPGIVVLFSIINFQFMVLRDGRWQKINFERNDNLLDSTADSHVVLGSPWIRHFTSLGKRRTERSLYVQEHGVLHLEGTHLKGNLTFASGSSRGLDHQGSFGGTTGNFD